MSGVQSRGLYKYMQTALISLA
uniref:Uncharacterized protein n=1 Tax=Anguilla anguilla TaxID=7936 RepID=A0A0E9U6T2_ANGAN